MSLAQLQQLLNGASPTSLPAGLSRIRTALVDLELGKASPSDVAVLVRQHLRSDDTQRTGQGPEMERARLELRDGKLLDEIRRTDFGLSVSPTATGALVSANPWRPKWLDLQDHRYGVDGAILDSARRRVVESAPADPFARSVLGREEYASRAQREAVRTAVWLRHGETMLANLPTGSGKTSVLFAPAFLSPRHMSSIVIVPTVALALDLQRRALEADVALPPTAYHSGLSPDAKTDFRRRIYDGQQPLIFTNPEAVVSSLSQPILEAARRGRLSLMAIDEAHLVSTWGDGFRPHFQLLAGLWRAARRAALEAGHAPLRTILTSATITQDTFDLLSRLFTDGTDLIHIGAPSVRPEHEYWVAPETDPQTRRERLIEAVRHLPRPLIIYTTIRDASRNQPGLESPSTLERLLRDAGFSRVAKVDGESSAQHRERVLRGVRAEGPTDSMFDVVVATSAFGLGIDVPDVRCVIHACVPETVDRFYQEVGRSGRDGRAALSLLLPTQLDSELAVSMSPRVLTARKAQERWKALMAGRNGDSGALVHLPRSATTSSIAHHSERNEQWNLITLNLLARAGAIAWDFPEPHATPSEEDRADAWGVVRILRGDLQTDHFWTTEFEKMRGVLQATARAALTSMRTVLSPERCVGMVLADHFGIETPHGRINCVPACGGCATCRREQRTPWSVPAALPSPIIRAAEVSSAIWPYTTIGQFGRVLTVTEDWSGLSDRQFRRQMTRLVETLSLQTLVLSDLQLLSRLSGPLSELSMPVLVDTWEDHQQQPERAELCGHFAGDASHLDLALKGNPNAPLTIVLAHPKMSCSLGPVQDLPGTLTLSQLLKRM